MKINQSIYPIIAGLLLASGIAKAQYNLCPLTYTGTISIQTEVIDPKPDDNQEIGGSTITLKKLTNKDILQKMVDDGIIPAIKGYALYAQVDMDSGSIAVFAIRNAKNQYADDYDAVSASNYIDLSSRTEISFSEAEKYSEKVDGDGNTTSITASGSFSSAIQGARLFAYGNESTNPHVGNIKGTWGVAKFTYKDGETYTEYWQQLKSAVATLMGGVYVEASSSENDCYSEATIKLGAGMRL